MAQAAHDSITSQKASRRALDARTRVRLEAAVDRLIAALDALDAPTEDKEDDDADDPTRYEGHSEAANAFLKPDDSEPSLGWTTTTNQTARQYHGGVDDLEDEHDGREDDEREADPAEMGIGDAGGLAEQVNGEPSLGSFDRMTNQENAYQDRRGWAPQDGEVDPGHRPATEAQRTRWRGRPYGDPLLVTVDGQKVRAAAIAGRMFKPHERYYIRIRNGKMIEVVGAAL